MSVASVVRRCAVRMVVVLLAIAACGVTSATAQPPLAQMSGIPLPDPQLPDGTITVRVVRGSITNNVVGQTVELRQGDTVLSAVTDDQGRATFASLNPGGEVRVMTVLDSQLLQSQPFPAPGRGGVRVMLAAADSSASSDAAPAVESGTVTFGEESWIQIELVEESIEVYFFLDIINPSSGPVEPAQPIVIDMPSGAQGTTVLRSSSPRAVADGPRVEIPGPFPPGSTPLHFAYILPYSGERLLLSQTLPVDLDALLVSVEQWGTVDFVSSQVQRRLEIPPEAPSTTPYLLGGGPAIPAGQALTLELVGLPHHDTLASTVTVLVSVGILVAGFWAGLGPAVTSEESTGRRQKLEARREKLFTDLVTLERQHRAGTVGPTKYASRREELFRALEKVYGDLDDGLTSVLVGS